jgi:signal transduction histidine kinase
VQVAAPMHEFMEALQRFRNLLLFALPALLLVATVGGYWISRRALRPVDEMTAAAQSISIRNLSGRVSVPQTGDELQRLSETLNEMLERLNDSVERMSQFTADASHELRAPVSVVRTTAELAIRTGRDEQGYREDMTHILDEAKRMGRLIDSLLMLARADARDDQLERRSVDLRQCITGAAKKTGGEFEFDLPAEPVTVNGDEGALERVFFILLDNAVKYTPGHEVARVSVREEAGSIAASVKDHGIGIPAVDHARIFNRFWRADKVRSRGIGGAGLGLAIAKWLVERHGGSIALQSAPGAGSTFTVRLPKSGNGN